MTYGIITNEDQLRIDAFEIIEDWMSEVINIGITNTLIQAMFLVKIHHKIGELGRSQEEEFKQKASKLTNIHEDGVCY